jgi:hypothetical protein
MLVARARAWSDPREALRPAVGLAGCGEDGIAASMVP